MIGPRLTVADVSPDLFVPVESPRLYLDQRVLARTVARREEGRVIAAMDKASRVPFPLTLVWLPDTRQLEVRFGHVIRGALVSADALAGPLRTLADVAPLLLPLAEQGYRKTEALPVPGNIELGEE